MLVDCRERRGVFTPCSESQQLPSAAAWMLCVRGPEGGANEMRHCWLNAAWGGETVRVTTGGKREEGR